jgi:hypothetical protein
METATAPTISKRREVMLFSHRSILAASVAIVVVLSVTRAQSGTIVNGGFETGTLDGWTNVAAGDAQVSVVQGGAPEGNYYAHLSADGFAVNHPDAYASLGSAAPFSASAGDVLTFNYRASTWVNDPLAGYATARAWLSGGISDIEIPLLLGTGWTTASVTLPESRDYSLGTYLNVEALVYNDGSQTIIGAASGAMDVDNVHVTPEPSTLVLAAVGLIGLLAYVWRKCR